jgi:hypothetical protein
MTSPETITGILFDHKNCRIVTSIPIKHDGKTYMWPIPKNIQAVINEMKETSHVERP